MDPISGLSGPLQWVIYFGVLFVTVVSGAWAQVRHRSKLQQFPRPEDDSFQIVGGSMADRASIRLLADACNRIAAAIEAHDADKRREREREAEARAQEADRIIAEDRRREAEHREEAKRRNARRPTGGDT